MDDPMKLDLEEAMQRIRRFCELRPSYPDYAMIAHSDYSDAIRMGHLRALCVPPEARQSAATPGAYRWIEKAVMLLKIAQQRALPMEDFWCELDTILAGVPVPPQDLGFNSPADLYARAWHALHSVRSPLARSQHVCEEAWFDSMADRCPACREEKK